ncbi:hypothetical protein [Maridesulfovibrio sp.]|uniref:hypothetical protein n=1 Tax=Maridesulfovibrio sp. TaxID=2795000 RepID=UPI0029CA4507|nr:hypothetical protein [Maridesulfovibrio sp.]
MDSLAMINGSVPLPKGISTKQSGIAKVIIPFGRRRRNQSNQKREAHQIKSIFGENSDQK